MEIVFKMQRAINLTRGVWLVGIFKLFFLSCCAALGELKILSAELVT